MLIKAKVTNVTIDRKNRFDVNSQNPWIGPPKYRADVRLCGGVSGRPGTADVELKLDDMSDTEELRDLLQGAEIGTFYEIEIRKAGGDDGSA